MDEPMVIRDDDRECRNIRAKKLFGDHAKLWTESLWGQPAVYCASRLPPTRVKSKSKKQ